MANVTEYLGNIRGPQGPTGPIATPEQLQSIVNGLIYRGNLPDGTDLNKFGASADNGSWRISTTGHTNGPGITSAGVLEVIRQPGDSGVLAVLQRVTDSTATWWREAVDFGLGTWGAWKKVATPEDISEYAVGHLGATNDQRKEFVVKDRRQRTALKVHRDGSTSISELNTGGSKIRKGADGFAIVDARQRTAFKVNPDGSVLIPNLIDGSGGGGSVAPAVLKVVLVVMLGQSNGEGRGRPVSARLDPQDARIRMYDWTSQSLKTATVPLSSPQQQVGLSPATPIARRFVEESQSTVAVVLNAAAGGSGLVADPAQGCWKVDYTGSNPALYADALAALSRTRSLIQSQYGLTPEVWFYWHQGESDTSTSKVAYAEALDALIAGFRSAVGDPSAPFTVGGLVPERIAGTALEGIREVHMATPARNEYAAYADGIANGGGSADPGDQTHYNRAGILALGDRMYEASMVAATASANQVPHKPLHVNAWLTGGDLIVSWSAPDTRYTSFVVEYQIGSGAWVSQTTTTAALTATITGVSGSKVQVRVSSRNGTVASLPTIPVLAL